MSKEFENDGYLWTSSGAAVNPRIRQLRIDERDRITREFQAAAEKKRIELHNQKMKKYKISQQQKKEFKKVAKKYNSKGTEKVKKELDKNFAETGRYESDKSKKSRLDRELKIANARKKNRWIPGDQHRGDWNDK